VRVLKASYIREFSVVSTGEDPLDPAGCVLDLDAIHAREEAALRCVNHSLFIWAREMLYFGCLCLGCYNEWCRDMISRDYLRIGSRRGIPIPDAP
jgi:hypothetical protein